MLHFSSYLLSACCQVFLLDRFNEEKQIVLLHWDPQARKDAPLKGFGKGSLRSWLQNLKSPKNAWKGRPSMLTLETSYCTFCPLFRLSGVSQLTQDPAGTNASACFPFLCQSSHQLKTFSTVAQESKHEGSPQNPVAQVWEKSSGYILLFLEESKLISCRAVFVETTPISLLWFCVHDPQTPSCIENSHWSGDNKNRKPQSCLCIFIMLFCCCFQFQSPTLNLPELSESRSSVLLLKKNQ